MISIDHIMTADYNPTMQEYPTDVAGLDRIIIEHRHDYYQIMILERGTSTILCENSVRRVSAPYVVFYPIDTAHLHINNQSQPYYRVNFHPNEMNTPLADASPIPEQFSVLELSTAEYERLTPYIRLLMDVPDTHHRESHMEMLLWAFLFELSHLRNTHQPEASIKQRPPAAGLKELVYKICVYLGENYMEKCYLDELANRFFISRAKLVRIFHEETGMTVGEYLKSVRIINARRCLRMGYSVQETSEQCGFPSASYFIHCFSAAVGCTPHKYAAQIHARDAVIRDEYPKT